MRFTTAPSHIWFVSAPITTSSRIAPVSEQNSSIEVFVYPEWYKQVTLEWKVPSTWSGVTYNVYFWPGGNEAYTKLNHMPIGAQNFSDTSTREYSKSQTGFYIVEAMLPFTTQIVRSPPASWTYTRRDKIERIANEIQRREYMLLSKFAGAKSFLFRLKTYGTRCPRCWNEELEKVMDDNCEICFGTSWDGGFYDPVPLYLQYDPREANKQKTYQGIVESNSLHAWTISIPEINSGDVIVRTGSWNVYKVLVQNVTELQTKIVRQILTLSQMAKSDIENKLVNKIQRDDAHDYLHQFEGKFIKKRFPDNLIDKSQDKDPEWAKKQNLPNLPEYRI